MKKKKKKSATISTRGADLLQSHLERKVDKDRGHKLRRSSLLYAAQDAWISILLISDGSETTPSIGNNAVRKLERGNEWTERERGIRKTNKKKVVLTRAFRFLTALVHNNMARSPSLSLGSACLPSH